MNRYPKFFDETFNSEGYFQNDPNDSGNYYQGKLYGTICGITAKNHFDEFQKALKLYIEGRLEELKKYCMFFYQREGYWKIIYNEICDSSLAFKVWDFGVNSSPRNSVKLLQKIIINHWGFTIKKDGEFGIITLAAVDRAFVSAPKKINKQVKMVKGESIIYSYYVWEIEKYYRSRKNFWHWGSGWLRRLFSVFNKVPDKIKDIDIEPRPTIRPD